MYSQKSRVFTFKLGFLTSFVIVGQLLGFGVFAVTGGILVDSTKSPWSHSVLHLIAGAPGGISSCSGTLIGPSVVLTAGHCLINFQGKSLYAAPVNEKTGAMTPEGIPVLMLRSSDNRTKTFAIDYKIHPKYKELGPGNVQGDIGLIRLT